MQTPPLQRSLMQLQSLWQLDPLALVRAAGQQMPKSKPQ